MSTSHNPPITQNPARGEDLSENNQNQNQPARQDNQFNKIENEEDRLVSFSKRRAGIYKKASEISILCGAQIGIIILSPSEKVFTYGSPNIKAVVDRFCERDTENVVDLATTAHEAQHNPVVQENNNMHNELSAKLDTLKKDGTRLLDIVKHINQDFWWDTPLEKLTPEQMQKLAKAMEQVKDSARERIKTLVKNEADATNIACSSNQGV